MRKNLGKAQGGVGAKSLGSAENSFQRGVIMKSRYVMVIIGFVCVVGFLLPSTAPAVDKVVLGHPAALSGKFATTSKVVNINCLILLPPVGWCFVNIFPVACVPSNTAAPTRQAPNQTNIHIYTRSKQGLESCHRSGRQRPPSRVHAPACAK